MLSVMRELLYDSGKAKSGPFRSLFFLPTLSTSRGRCEIEMEWLQAGKMLAILSFNRELWHEPLSYLGRQP